MEEVVSVTLPDGIIYTISMVTTKEWCLLFERSKTALTTFIFALILVGMTGFTLRSIPDLPDYRPASVVNIAEQDEDYTWDSHIKAAASFVRTDEVMSAPVLPAIVPAAAFTLTFIVRRFHVKSHIEYCGKKMVRAIMLQWRPNWNKHYIKNCLTYITKWCIINKQLIY